MEAQATASASNADQPQEFDFWEFVACSKCHLAFSSDGVSAPTVPFWLSDCGHILCNSHLNADQSCPSCNAQRIELMPLQKEFQQESLAASLRYYKNRCAQYRTLLERVKGDMSSVKSLKKENEALKHEVAQLRSGWKPQTEQQQEGAQIVNANGKRPRVDHRMSMSSPRSIHTPLGPQRITLPPEHDPPPLFAKPGGPSRAPATPRSVQKTQGLEVPGASHFTQQYAYNPPQTPQMLVQPQQGFSHAQQAPARLLTGQMQAQTQSLGKNHQRLMPPPPTPDYARQNGADRQIQRFAMPRISNPVHGKEGTFYLDSFTPQQQQQPTFVPTAEDQQPMMIQSRSQTPRRFVPSSASGKHSVPPRPTGASQCLPPKIAMLAEQGRFVPSTASGRTAPGSAQHKNSFAHTQRAGFIPST
ncbi:hypothetical protein EW145_g1067 [Phellinidium pouzarii]|uniref:RING-type domain-containing protein n=1 Tax=Phellinidium pouzarii TaxID=167371 RepID=A0A4S4LGH4_9AGAM|nr:hypothetical protein EW145_g1067 [Phellinidium pouzarii]